jgi:hypothetical protein
VGIAAGSTSGVWFLAGARFLSSPQRSVDSRAQPDTYPIVSGDNMA